MSATARIQREGVDARTRSLWLGREYVGVDLSERQVEANREQAEQILDYREPETITVKVSGAWARHCFNCTPDYIISECHGRCCEGTDKILISLLLEEAERHKALGYAVKDGRLEADPLTGKCPHKGEDGLCKVHGTDLKPFGCIASPFTLGQGDTLIVRQRYTRLRCHKQGEPAYKTFRASLDLIFGEAEADRIVRRLDAGADTVEAEMPYMSYRRLRYLDSIKHGTAQDGGKSTGLVDWIVGDSRDLPDLVQGPFDFLFTCPPYYDLEIYSDDPRDISTLPEYGAFLEVYRGIVAKGVALLSDDRFACICVGDVRDRDGFYHGFVEDTVGAFENAGARKYNEAILITAVGSLPIRVGKQFESGRKLGKTHQNVLVFCKGDPRKATEAVGPVEVSDLVYGPDEVAA